MKDISMHILDIVGNSIRAGSDLTTIKVIESKEKNRLELIFEDIGCGMDDETIKKAMDPFYTSRSTRKVGLGIPLLIQNTQQTGGDVKITSIIGEGTKLKAEFVLDHIDLPPMGDLPGTTSLIITGNPKVDFIFEFEKNKQSYKLDSREIKVALEDVDIQNPQVAVWIQQMIEENLREIGLK